MYFSFYFSLYFRCIVFILYFSLFSGSPFFCSIWFSFYLGVCKKDCDRDVFCLSFEIVHLETWDPDPNKLIGRNEFKLFPYSMTSDNAYLDELREQIRKTFSKWIQNVFASTKSLTCCQLWSLATSKTCNFKHQGIHIHCLALKLMLYIRNIAFLRNKARNALHYSKTSPFSNLMIIEPFDILTKITTLTSFNCCSKRIWWTGIYCRWISLQSKRISKRFSLLID